MPADTKKSLLWFGVVFAGVFALCCVLLFVMGMLEGAMMLFAAVFALIAGMITVSVLTGQLKQAASVSGAENYVVKGSFQLHSQHDHYLHTTQTRRKIEQKQPQDKP